MHNGDHGLLNFVMAFIAGGSLAIIYLYFKLEGVW